jgi:mRNA interferase HigB
MVHDAGTNHVQIDVDQSPMQVLIGFNSRGTITVFPEGSHIRSFPASACSQIGNTIHYTMRVISVKALKLFWDEHPDAETSLRAWYTEAKKAVWKRPQDIKAAYRTASILRNNRVVFNIKGNTYRLVVAVRYEFQIVYIRFVGTHEAYNRPISTFERR